MSLLLHVFSDMLLNPQLLSHSHTNDLNLKPKIGHTDSSYPAPPIPKVITTATNPKQIGLTDRDLNLTEMRL